MRVPELLQAPTGPNLAARLVLSLDPVRDTQAIFRVTLEAMTRPGHVLRIPVAAREAPTNAWTAALLMALLDAETSLAVEPFAGADELAHFVQLRTAARRVAPEHAGFVVADAQELDPALLGRLPTGSLEFPDDSATLIVQVRGLEQSGVGLRARCSGPGVLGEIELTIRGLDPAFLEARAQLEGRYPRGIDVLLIDPLGRLVGLPRSTRVRLVGEA